MSLKGKKLLVDVPIIATSHHCGRKRVLINNEDTPSAITQIAVTALAAGERVSTHLHPTMEEYFLIRKGRLRIHIQDDSDDFGPDSFIRIPANAQHSMEALSDCELLTIGCACEGCMGA